ncbi:hypothetical protein [Puia dinghuensis]|nr:hypothetical protein [Puia dinghuensis]
MKKLIFLMLCAGIGFVARAQTTQDVKDDQARKKEMKDLRSDVRERKAAKDKENKDLAHVKIRKAMNDHKVVAKENKDEHADARKLKDRGVDHAIAKAKRQNKVQDDNRKDHTQ